MDIRRRKFFPELVAESNGLVNLPIWRCFMTNESSNMIGGAWVTLCVLSVANFLHWTNVHNSNICNTLINHVHHSTSDTTGGL